MLLQVAFFLLNIFLKKIWYHSSPRLLASALHSFRLHSRLTHDCSLNFSLFIISLFLHNSCYYGLNADKKMFDSDRRHWGETLGETESMDWLTARQRKTETSRTGLWRNSKVYITDQFASRLPRNTLYHEHTSKQRTQTTQIGRCYCWRRGGETLAVELSHDVLLIKSHLVTLTSREECPLYWFMANSISRTAFYCAVDVPWVRSSSTGPMELSSSRADRRMDNMFYCGGLWRLAMLHCMRAVALVWDTTFATVRTCLNQSV